MKLGRLNGWWIVILWTKLGSLKPPWGLGWESKLFCRFGLLCHAPIRASMESGHVEIHFYQGLRRTHKWAMCGQCSNPLGNLGLCAAWNEVLGITCAPLSHILGKCFLSRLGLGIRYHMDPSTLFHHHGKVDN